MVDSALLFLVLHFQVGQSGLAAGAPIDYVVSLVDQPFLVEADEDLPHCPGEGIVHGEALPAPVHGRAHALDLVQDLIPVFLFPLPDPLHETLPAHILSADALLLQGPLHHVLGGYTRVIRARNPEHVVATLPFVAAEHVLQGYVQGVPHVQTAGDIGRGDDHGKGGGPALRIRGKGSLLIPEVPPALLHLLGLVSLGQFGFSTHLPTLFPVVC